MLKNLPKWFDHFDNHTDVPQKLKKSKTSAPITSLAKLRTIMLVDDAPETRSLTKLFLTSFGFLVHSFSNAEDALGSFDPELHDAVVTDNSMPGMTGEEMAHVVKMRSRSTPVIMYSGTRPSDTSCFNSVLIKPAPLALLKDVLDKHLG